MGRKAGRGPDVERSALSELWHSCPRPSKTLAVPLMLMTIHDLTTTTNNRDEHDHASTNHKLNDLVSYTSTR